MSSTVVNVHIRNHNKTTLSAVSQIAENPGQTVPELQTQVAALAKLSVELATYCDDLLAAIDSIFKSGALIRK
jgi:hypothetical protein